MDINSLLTSDEELKVIDDGTWVGDFADAPGLSLYVVGLTSKEARKAMEAKQAKLRLKNRGKPLTSDQLAQCTRETLYEVVLKDWSGLMSDGKEVKYDKALAKKWIESRNGEKFTNLVLEASQILDREAGEFVKEVTKN